MAIVRPILVRMRSLLRRDVVERELDEELQFHIAQETERLIGNGVPAAEAAAAARRTFGNVENLKEESRDARGVRVIDNVTRDLGYALRLARRQPVFTGVIVLSLALGLGAATAVFSLTYNVIFANLPVRHPSELTMLTRVTGDGRDAAFSRAEYEAIRAQANLGTFAAVRGASQIAVELGTAREFINIQLVDGAFFSMVGIVPVRGRLITRSDDAQQSAVAVLSAAFAEQLAPGDSAIVGRTIRIRGAPFTVIGITPPRFRGLDFPGQFTVAIPLSAASLLNRAGPRNDDRGHSLGAIDPAARAHLFRIVGRVSRDRAAIGAAITQLLAACCSDGATPDQRIVALDIRRGITNPKDNFRGELGTLLLILLGAMGLLVVVVCCNVASLLVVRSSARAREIAVRLSLGASRGRLVSQLLLETLPLALGGGVAGLFVAEAATSALVRSVPEWDTYVGVLAFRPQPVVMLFAAGATLLSALGFAVYPALLATRSGFAQSLRTDARRSRTRRQGMVARGVVIAQIALAVVLVTAATLMTITLRNLRHVDGGFAVDRVLLVSLETRGTIYETRGTTAIHKAIVANVAAVPSVRMVAAASLLPMFGGSTGYPAIDVPGYTKARDERQTPSLFIAVTPGYFSAAGIPLERGREFGAEDAADATPAVIVSRAFARRYFGDRDAVGRTFRANINGDSLSPIHVVGVAADAKYTDLRSAPEPIMYVPLAQTTERWSGLQLVVRTRLDASAAAHDIIRAIETATPGIRVRRVSDMHARLDIAMAVQRLAAELAGFAGAMVIALCAIGLYGVVAYSVSRRTSEIGIRMALGADAIVIVRLVAAETMHVVGIGILLGLVGAFAVSGVLSSQLFGVGAHDPVAMLMATIVLAIVAIVACAVPASRAARIDPSIALAAD